MRRSVIQVHKISRLDRPEIPEFFSQDIRLIGRENRRVGSDNKENPQSCRTHRREPDHDESVHLDERHGQEGAFNQRTAQRSARTQGSFVQSVRTSGLTPRSTGASIESQLISTS